MKTKTKKTHKIRKCIGCMEMKNKNELIRITRTNNTEFSLDLTGKMPGRGAYVCQNLDCLEKAHRKKGLERSFKQAIPDFVYNSLREALKNG